MKLKVHEYYEKGFCILFYFVNMRDNVFKILSCLFACLTAVLCEQTAAVAKSTQDVFGYLGENITMPSGVNPSWNLTKIEWSILTNTTWIATYRNGISNTERFHQYTGRLSLNTTSGNFYQG